MPDSSPEAHRAFLTAKHASPSRKKSVPELNRTRHTQEELVRRSHSVEPEPKPVRKKPEPERELEIRARLSPAFFGRCDVKFEYPVR